MTTEQQAVLRAKTLRLHLDLTDAQETQLKKVFQSQMESIKAHRKKAMAERLSQYDRKLHFLDSQLALKEQLKSILTKDQYEKWSRAQGKKKTHRHAKSQKDEGRPQRKTRKKSPPKKVVKPNYHRAITDCKAVMAFSMSSYDRASFRK